LFQRTVSGDSLILKYLRNWNQQFFINSNDTPFGSWGQHVRVGYMYTIELLSSKIKEPILILHKKNKIIEPGLTVKQCSRKLENQVKGHTLNCQLIASSFMKANSCLKLFQNPKLEVLLILIFFFKNLN
jgi:hypothetical protein